VDARPPAAPLALIAIVLAAFPLGAIGCGDDDDESTNTATEETVAVHGPDLTALPLGNDKFTNSPKRGYVYLCNEPVEGVAPTANVGPWVDEAAGTWNADEKPVVPGEVTWPSEFEVGEGGELRGVSGNDLPDHPTGEFPIPADSTAYEYDQNPNEISAQEILLEFPYNPKVAAEPSCMGGESGVLLTGAALFNAFDANGDDAVAHEVQDQCDGHPQVQGVYHYHSQSDCVTDNEAGEGHSPLVGYALDGFGIYGHHGEDGEVLTNEDLDECHGHTHEIEWNGNPTELFHYHSTYEFPYVVGCFRGEPAALQVTAGGNGQGGAPPEGGEPPAGGPPEGAPPPPG
jgi:YHYH protein